jgi:hypothetical protein
MSTVDINLNICTWNVGGIISDGVNKFTDKTFTNQIIEFDIVLLTETHLGYNTSIELEGFSYYPVCREKSANNRYFGGLGILVKKTIRKGISILQNTNTEFQWIRLKSEFFSFETDIYLCLAYIPPISSGYSRNGADNDILELLERDFTKYRNLGNIIITGDFNARTGNELDYINGDGTSHIPLNKDLYSIDANVGKRYSRDNVIDSRGKDLLEICIANKLRIVNGRVFGDSHGKFTCHNYIGSSVVDYFIVSEQLLQDIMYFHVHDFLPLSDCHCKISMKILSSFKREFNNDDLIDMPTRYKWDNSSVAHFQNYFTHPIIQRDIKSFLNKTIQLNEIDINEATNDIHNIFNKVAKFSLQKKARSKKHTDNKKWFDSDLWQKRKQLFGKATLLSRYPNNPIIRGSYFKLRKEYAKLRKYKKRQFTQNFLDKLDHLNESHPKEYWELVSQIREANDGNRKKTEKCIDGGTWFNYFNNLFKLPEKHMDRLEAIRTKIKEFEDTSNLLSFTKLDYQISLNELQMAISSLKSGKSPGLDNITNEMLKAAQTYMNQCFLKLFNKVFISGFYPQKWVEGYITPIFKMDNPRLPQNYRGITITNGIGKLFNIILNKRLDNFLLDNNIIHESQIGFTKKARTSDHLFVMKCLIDKYINTGNKRLYACFVDFHKAFDTVIHEGIKLKLLQLNINSLFYKIICNMYKYSSISVKLDNKLTKPFSPGIGVRQGDVLSPNIFKIFLNDLSTLLEEDQANSVSLSNKHIGALLYADDLVLISDNQNSLQVKLNLLNNYCRDWCLDININKTKIIIFNKRGHLITEKFSVDNTDIECVKHYKYLGIILSSSGSFKEAKSYLYKKALKSAFKIYKDIKHTDPPIRTLLHLFDHLVKPIVTYGSEIWGTLSTKMHNTNKDLYETFKDWEIETLHIKFCKFIIGSGKKSTNIAILSELGRLPIFYSVLISFFTYWHRLANIPENTLLHSAYRESVTLDKSNVNTWFTNMTHLSNKLGITLSNCVKMKISTFKRLLKKKTRENFLEYWFKMKDKGCIAGKLSTYFDLKQNFCMEKYLFLKNYDLRKIICKFRISAHNLRIESGRYERIINNEGKKVILERNKRFCKMCDKNCVEDEIHSLIDCPLYSSERQTFFHNILKYNTNFIHLSSKEKFQWLMSNEDSMLLTKLGHFLTSIFQMRNNIQSKR